MRRAFLLVTLLAAVSCNEPAAVVDPVVTTSVASAWSGSTVAFHSPSFAQALPVVSVAGKSLTAIAAGGDSIFVTMPDSGGLLDIVITMPDGGHSTLPLQVYGFAGSHPDIPMDPSLGPWPYGGDPALMVISGGRLLAHNLRTRGDLALSGDSAWNTCRYVAAILFSLMDPKQVAMEPGCGPAVTFPVMPGGMAPDTGPAQGGNVLVHLARGRWLIQRKNLGYQLWVRQPGGTFTTTTLAPTPVPPFGMTVSPRGDRFLPVNSDNSGLPVFDSSGTLAYTLPITSNRGTAFSPDGDTLFFVTPDSLLAVNASTGARQRAAPLSPRGFTDLAPDPQAGWLYEASTSRADTTLVVRVINRGTLAVAATMRTPRGAVPWNATVSNLVRVVVDGPRRTLYVVVPLDPSTVATFVLP